VPLVSVSVLEKGTSNGVATDLEGKYSIQVADGATLVFSYTGYTTQEVKLGAENSINITLEEGITTDEVVVTALGIQKSTKALTYSATEVDASSFGDARETNVINSLAGKVAGVNVSSTATGAGGSSRVIIRGNNSLSGSNQPLYVVDGVPIDNTNLGAAGMWGGADGGDGISSINPNDIESMTVLKGTSAAALYGYRSANGVILITTKSGNKRKGIGVEFNTQLRTDHVINTYDFQQEYGHGRLGAKPGTQAEALDQGLYAWGAALDGSNVMQFDGVERPYSAHGDNLSNFYQTGLTYVNTLTLTGGNDKYNFRFSASNLDNSDIVPNSGLTRRNFTLRTNAQFTDKFRATVLAMYVNENAQNRPRLSDSPGNANYTAWSLPTSIDINDLKGDANKLGANSDGTELQFNDNVFVTNPFWAAHQFENNSTKNRLTGKVQLQYDIMQGLYVRGKIGLDRYNNRTRNLTPYGTAYSAFGQISEGTREVSEINSEIMLGYDKDLTEDVGISVFVGANRQQNVDESIGGSGSNFNVPFLHSITNTANRSVNYGFGATQVNSWFGSAEISLMRAIYLNGTYRNDYFSTLTSPTGTGENNQGYFSAGISAVLSDLMSMPSVIDFAKVRLSYGTGSGIGQAGSPYQLNLTYGIFGQGHLGNPLGGISNGSIPNAALVPLLTSEFEAGFDVRLLGGLLNLDFTYYNRGTESDIIGASVSPTSGYGSKIVNLGKMTNNGVELLLTARPVKTADFTWDIGFNYGRNNNTVVSLLTEADDGETIRDGESRTRNAYIEHVEGLPYSQIAGFQYARNADGSIELDADGLPVQGEFTHFGTGVHPNMYGINNEFRYKNLTISFLVDIRTGGKIYAATNAYGYFRGLHQATLQGRTTGLGIVEASEVENYYQRIAFGITEEFVADASFAKLRQALISYNVPKDVLGGLPIGGLTLSIGARNLAILWKNVDNIDPESTYNTSNGQGLEMFGVPSTRSFQFNLGIRF
jgi:TonB-linked SusC/RagA family outer membrane protein